MSYDQFWNDDVEIAPAYRKTHEITLDEENQKAWIQGAYVYSAIAALAPALKAFAKGRAQPYMQHPIGYEEKQRAEMEARERNRKAREETDKARTILEAWAIGFNEKWEKKNSDKLTMKSGESEDGRNNDSRDRISDQGQCEGRSECADKTTAVP